MGVVVAAVAAAVAWNVIPPSKHTARTLIHIPPGNLVVQGDKTNPVDLQRTLVALAKGRLVLNAALKRPGISGLEMVRSQANPLDWLEKEVQVDFSVAPDVIRIAISGDDSNELGKLVAALREAYRSEIFEKFDSERHEHLNTLVKQLQIYTEQLKAKKETAHLLEDRGVSKDLGYRAVQQHFLQFELGWYERDLIQTESELNRATIERAMRQDAAKGLATATVPDAELQSLLSRDPLVLASQDHVKQWKDFIAQFREKSAKGDADPALQKHLKALADAELALEKLKKDLVPQVSGAWRVAQRAAAAEASHQSETKVAMLTAAAKSMREQVDALQKKCRRRP